MESDLHFHDDSGFQSSCHNASSPRADGELNLEWVSPEATEVGGWFSASSICDFQQPPHKFESGNDNDPNYCDSGHVVLEPHNSTDPGKYSDPTWVPLEPTGLRGQLPTSDAYDSQPSSISESENDGDPNSYDYLHIQSSSHTTFGPGGYSDFSPTAIPPQATNTSNWPIHPDDFTADSNFQRGGNSGLGMGGSPWATACAPSNLVQYPDTMCHSNVTFRLHNEHVKSPVFAPLQNLELLPDEESEERVLYIDSKNNSGMYPQQFKPTASSRSRPVIRPRRRASRFVCNIRPCNFVKPFSRKADLERHITTQHSLLYPSGKLYDCPWPGCERKANSGFTRRDKMLQHQDKDHMGRAEFVEFGV